jgi:hypothetical protein
MLLNIEAHGDRCGYSPSSDRCERANARTAGRSEIGGEEAAQNASGMLAGGARR